MIEAADVLAARDMTDDATVEAGLARMSKLTGGAGARRPGARGGRSRMIDDPKVVQLRPRTLADMPAQLRAMANRIDARPWVALTAVWPGRSAAADARRLGRTASRASPCRCISLATPTRMAQTALQIMGRAMGRTCLPPPVSP